MGKDWLIVGAVIVILLAAVCIGEIKDGDEDRAIVTPTPRPTPDLPPATEEDLWVWRLCSSALAGELTSDQLQVIYRINDANLSRQAEESKKVVYLVRVGLDAMDTLDPVEWTQSFRQACRDLRAADAKAWGLGD